MFRLQKTAIYKRSIITLFFHFCLKIEEKVSDATTVLLYLERLVELGLLDALFKRFAAYLDAEGYKAKKGQIIDASIVGVPEQRNDREENHRIKEGEVPEDWNNAKRRQKDMQARWPKKHDKNYYGYKSHIGFDHKNKLILHFRVSDVSVQDSQVLDDVVDLENSGAGLLADNAHRSEGTEAVLIAGYCSQIDFKESGTRHRRCSSINAIERVQRCELGLSMYLDFSET